MRGWNGRLEWTEGGISNMGLGEEREGELPQSIGVGRGIGDKGTEEGRELKRLWLTCWKLRQNRGSVPLACRPNG